MESYRFSELIESHAVDTYAEFVETNADMLHEFPAPDVARDYYASCMYYFYEFQLSANQQPEDGGRRLGINSLYDVFQNILFDKVRSCFIRVTSTIMTQNTNTFLLLI